ncbi:hypothetical protein M885DRAFT_164216 [Pelagophyceae sp. CCMP2097]|nr:hypothetical protein M885DRAFT_164216 [Pelagophyceae sp. CCMP2097]
MSVGWAAAGLRCCYRRVGVPARPLRCRRVELPARGLQRRRCRRAAARGLQQWRCRRAAALAPLRRLLLAAALATCSSRRVEVQSACRCTSLPKLPKIHLPSRRAPPRARGPRGPSGARLLRRTSLRSRAGTRRRCRGLGTPRCCPPQTRPWPRLCQC